MITQQQAVDAAIGSRGNVTYIAKKLGCDRAHVYRLIDKWPKLATAIAEAREARKDFAESRLDDLMTEGNVTAIIFFLKTQAKERGYIERQEVTGADGGAINIKVEYGDFNPDPTQTA